MQYFLMRLDKRIENIITFTDFPEDNHALLLKEQAKTFKDITTLFVEGDSDVVYPDFIENPVFLVSDELKKVLEIYDSTLIFKTVVLSNLKEETQKIYWLVLTDILDALSEKTEFYKNGWEKRILIDEEKTEGHRIFQVEGLQRNELLVHLDVAESILRRDFKGIELKKVESDVGEVG